jgi:hypothetical protein
MAALRPIEVELDAGEAPILERTKSYFTFPVMDGSFKAAEARMPVVEVVVFPSFMF